MYLLFNMQHNTLTVLPEILTTHWYGLYSGMSSSTDPHRAHHYCYCDLYLMSVLTSHKQIKNNLILARHSLQNMLAVILPEERE